METAMEDGTRKLVPGSYTLSVGGHQPGDKEGAAVSKVLTAAVKV